MSIHISLHDAESLDDSMVNASNEQERTRDLVVAALLDAALEQLGLVRLELKPLLQLAEARQIRLLSLQLLVHLRAADQIASALVTGSTERELGRLLQRDRPRPPRASRGRRSAPAGGVERRCSADANRP